jgi:hypothetical protein
MTQHADIRLYHHFYPVPDDDNSTLIRAISRLSDRERAGATWHPTEDWLLETHPTLAVVLSWAFRHGGVKRPASVLMPGAVFVPRHMKSGIANVLKWLPGCQAEWSRIEGVAFATARSKQAFEALI